MEILVVPGWVWVIIPIALSFLLVDFSVPIGAPVRVGQDIVVGSATPGTAISAEVFDETSEWHRGITFEDSVGGWYQRHLVLTPIWLGGVLAASSVFGMGRHYQPWARLTRHAVLLAGALCLIAVVELISGGRVWLSNLLWVARLLVVVPLVGLVFIPISTAFVKIGRKGLEVVALLTLFAFAVFFLFLAIVEWFVPSWTPGWPSAFGVFIVLGGALWTSIAGFRLLR